MKNLLLNVGSLTALFFVTLASAGNLNLATKPLYTGTSEAPMMMLVMGRDHTLYYEAYNDASDLNGDGVIDIKFMPDYDYEGYFDSAKCYKSENDIFVPQRKAETCTFAGEWSGNFLNYVTMTRMDVLRKVLYGGSRSTDSVSETVLERVFIPQDAHSWGKAYSSEAVDLYDIRDYTPYELPNGEGKQHFFGSVTYTSYNDAPKLRVMKNVYNALNQDDWGIWNWASTATPVLATNSWGDGHLRGITTTGELDYESYTVRVKVCVDTLLESNCVKYPEDDNYKPTGLLHDYGSDDQMLFGLLTGSFNKNLSGGVLRQAISQFSEEINANTGQFVSTDNGIVATIDKLKIHGFQYNGKKYVTNCGWITTRAINEGECASWGNPVGEMLYETMRYYSGVEAPSTSYATSGGYDGDLSLPTPDWDDPYDGRGTCSRPNILLISDINPSYDSDQLPGSYFEGSYSGSTLPEFNVSTLLSTISDAENKSEGDFFIGQSGTAVTDGAPTVKEISGLGAIRGLAPAEPTKEGSYSSAGVAYYGLKNDIHRTKAKEQNVTTMVVALASNLPEIEVDMDNDGTADIKIVPYAKSVGGSHGISGAPGSFQPTNTIVDWYVESISATRGVFRINFEDVEQGADHDMDMIVKYTYEVVDDLCANYNESNQCTSLMKGLRITLDSTYAAGSIDQHAGYIISGTTNDGMYLEVMDQEGNDTAYYLDTPDSNIYANRQTSGSSTSLGLTATRNFFPSTVDAAKFLPSPLWYAAKWGGFTDSNDSGTPNLDVEWDTNDDGLPDNYFPVTNAGELKSQLGAAFDLAHEGVVASTTPVFSSRFLVAGTRVYESSFEEVTWSGDIKAFQADESGTYPSTPVWSAATNLDAMTLSNRNIYTRGESGTIFEFDTDAIAAPGTFTSSQRLNLLGGNSIDTDDVATYTAAVINYIRGDRSQEEENSTYDFRPRISILGDIINSTPYYVANVNGHDVEKDILVFGANDGMVHVLDATSGDELFAYIPSMVYPAIGKVVNQGYVHQYSVDGGVNAYTEPAAGTESAKTTVVGALGLGYKGLYALDVSDMTGTPGSNVIKWEINAALSDYAGIGHMTAAPSIVKLALEDTPIGVIFSNGYNSSDAQGTLYIADIDDGSLIKKLTVPAEFTDPTGAGRPNALAQPAIIDTNGDGKADYIYAGDLFGNMWVFDISSDDKEEWGIKTTDSKPLFVATSPTKVGGSYVAQPITTRPSVVRHPSGIGVLIAFGTGKYIEGTDTATANQATQSFYVITDILNNSVITDVRGTSGVYSELQLQSVVQQTSAKRLLSENTVDWSTKKGFYIDLINTQTTIDSESGASVSSTNLGERQVTNSVLFANKVSFVTLIPDEDPCNAGGTGWYMELNLHTGQTWNLGTPLVDDPTTTEDESEGIAGDSSNTLVDGVVTGITSIISVEITDGDDGDDSTNPDPDPDPNPDPDPDPDPNPNPNPDPDPDPNPNPDPDPDPNPNPDPDPNPNPDPDPNPNPDPDPDPDPDPNGGGSDETRLKTCLRLTTGKVICFDDNLTPTGRLSWRNLY